MVDVVLRNNTATYGGGMYASGDDQIVIVSSVFANNKAYTSGGGLYTVGELNVIVTSR